MIVNGFDWCLSYHHRLCSCQGSSTRSRLEPRNGQQLSINGISTALHALVNLRDRLVRCVARRPAVELSEGASKELSGRFDSCSRSSLDSRLMQVSQRSTYHLHHLDYQAFSFPSLGGTGDTATVGS